MSEAEKTKNCPKCNGVAVDITPLKSHDRSMAVYACHTKGCGFTFRADGGAFVKDASALKDVFRGATLANQALAEALAGEKLNSATRALLLARLTEFGMQMWFDGVKQGLLLGAIHNDDQENTGADVRPADGGQVPSGE